jgi:predicted metal-binding membrane protein
VVRIPSGMEYTGPDDAAETALRMSSGQLAGRGPARSPLRRPSYAIPVAIVAATLIAWTVTIEQMRGMDNGPGTDLGGLGWFVGIWVTMTAAMMLPSVLPMALVFSRVSRERQKRGQTFVPTWVFLVGYLSAWTTYGLLAYGAFRAVQALHLHALGWHAHGPLIAGAAIVAAALYQLSPLKRLCLRHCRSPLHYVLGGWRSGRRGALAMGLEHGAYCVGCCWGLMLILFALGVMSIAWMLVIAGLIFAEKVLPFGQGFSRALAAALLIIGVWVAAAPSSVPGLTQPGAMRAMGPAMH